MGCQTIISHISNPSIASHTQQPWSSHSKSPQPLSTSHIPAQELYTFHRDSIRHVLLVACHSQMTGSCSSI
jgi:hypothetical protein